MKLLQKIVFYSLCFSVYNLYTQQMELENSSPSVSSEEQVIPEIIEQETVLKKDELADWQNHLQKLLVKGAFWDSVSNAPTNDWIDAALTIAQAALTNNISLADELKNSFFKTINEKFTTIEEGKDIQNVFDIINNFNAKIDEFVVTLSPKGESFESDSNVYTEEKNEPEDQIQEPFSVEPEEKITEDLSSEEQENLESDKKEKKKTKQQLLWQECLDNIKNEGTEKKEIEGIIEETTEIAQEMLKTVSDELQQEKAKELKEEFAEAVRERSEPLYPIDAHSVIKTFNNQIDMLVQNKAMQYQEPFFTEPVPQNIAEQKKPVIPEKSPQKNTTGPTISQPKPSVTTQPSSSGKITQSTIVVQQPSVDIATQKIQKETAEKAKNEALRKIKEQQELLAKKMQVTALQKAAEKKTESEKGIITSLKEKIFGKTETPEQRTVAELRKEQDQLIEQMVQHKFDRTAKDLIKTAYHIFQETLVGFDRPEFWDIDRNMPNKKWMKTIIEALKVLLKYDIMNLDTISTILKETLQTTSKMTIKSYTDIMNEINAQLQNYIQQIEKEKIERKKQAEREMKQQQQELIEQGERERQRIVVEELQKQEELHKQEQEKNNTIKQFTSLELEWERLLWKITQDKSASNASNRKFTEQALKITKNMVKLLPQMPIKNKKDIIEKHIQEFTKALIAQQKNNDEHINVHHYIEIFNIKIHTL